MRVLIVAEGVAAAEAVRRSMRYAPSFRVIGFVDGRARCSEAVERERPDVVVVDDLSAWSDALARMRDVRSAAPTTKIVLLTASVDARRLEEAAAAGVDAAIAKTANAASVGMLIREIAAGNVYHSFTRPAPARVATNESADGLTARELEILRLVAAGMANARIAATLWVTEQTVKFHLSNVYRKLGLANRTEASHYAHVNGLIETVPAPMPAATTAMEVAA